MKNNEEMSNEVVDFSDQRWVHSDSNTNSNETQTIATDNQIHLLPRAIARIKLNL